MARRARTRHLIELGGLVAKAGLIELAEDDRALLYGAFLDLAGQLRVETHKALRQRWKRRGARAFADEAETAKTAITMTEREDGTGAE